MFTKPYLFRMRHIYPFVLLFFLLPLYTIAQHNYKPGYVVTNKGDTLTGFIDYKEWATNPNSITFKTSLNDEKRQKYDTENMTGFSITGLESYRLYTGPITTDATDPNHISTGRDSSFKVVTVFLKVLLKGKKITLYAYDNTKRRFYISESSNYAPYELIYRIYLDEPRVIDGSRTVVEADYKKQLLMLAQKYSVLNYDISKEIRHSDYLDADLKSVVSQIDGGSKSEFKKAYNDKARINFYIGSAVNLATVTADGDYALAGGKNYKSTSPRAVVGFNVLLAPNTGRLILSAEISATNWQYRSDYMNKIYPYVLVHYSFDVFNLTFTPQIIYNLYNKPNFKIYGGAGLDFTSIKYSNEIFKSQDGQQVTVIYPFNFFEFSSVPFVKAGIILDKRFDIYTKFDASTPVSGGPFFFLDFSVIQIGVNYFFGKTGK